MSQRLQVLPSSGRFLSFRLKPGNDLREELEALTKQHKIQAGAIVTAVGSLRHATLRLADAKGSVKFTGKFEIVSLTGTLGPDGVHLHISLSDARGQTIGGHLLKGCPIYTTAEIVVVELAEVTFNRRLDTQTGYQELKINDKSVGSPAEESPEPVD